MASLTVGSTYSNYTDFNNAVTAFENENFVQFYRRDARTIEKVKRLNPRHHYNPELKYVNIHLTCIHGGRNFLSHSKGVRPKTSTCRVGCPALIKVKTTEDGERLVVKEMVKIHNHEVSEAAFKHYPKRRQLCPAERAKCSELLTKYDGNKRLVIEELTKVTGKVILPKDIHNIAATMNCPPKCERKKQEKKQKVTKGIRMVMDTDTKLREQARKRRPGSAFKDPRRSEKKLVLDVDTGVDDAQAIMMALAAPNVEVLGITCVSGNTSLENSCRNTLRVLNVCQRLEIPVFGGAAEPLMGHPLSAGSFHGQDGLGDAPDPDAPGLELLQTEGAVEAIIRLVNENPGEVCLVAMAPLTNLALAVKIDPTLPQKLKGLFIMGGNTDSRGNTTVCAEFNFAADPEAAYIVLNRFFCPTYIATWEFCCENKLPWSFCANWLAQDTDKARFMKSIFKHTMDTVATCARYQREMTAGPGFVSCNSYAMAAAIDDGFVWVSEPVAVTVELQGTYTRGMMVLDKLGVLEKEHQVVIMRTVDLESFKGMLMDSLK
uniref:Inosine/uridine-preferring nucleoside hydrolase domain-containing protein n=1 Tax=Hucho hucho TaxID=62062 RepID=A0A4W5KP40_9TELE